MTDAAPTLEVHPIHLDSRGGATSEPPFNGAMQWYADYGARHAADGAAGRLVSEHRFTESWTSWECHPVGAEIVYCLAGELILHQMSASGEIATIALQPGQYAINPPGVWHTADVAGEARALFITAGEGTQHRPR